MRLGIFFALSTLVLPAIAQETAIYGRINTAVESINASADAEGKKLGNTVRLSNYRSVLGFRGKEDLGRDVSVVWQIEGTVALDTGVGGVASRDTRLGIVSPYGTIFAGNWTTPYTSSTSKLDPFYPTTAGYMSIIGNGSAPSSDNVMDTTAFDRRQRNSIHYWTPDWNGASVQIAHGLSEEKTAGRAPSLTSVAAVYERQNWYVTLAHERHKDYQGAGLTDRGSKIGLAYDFGATRVAGIAEKLQYETSTGKLERKAFYLSVAHRIDRHSLKLGWAYAQSGEGSSSERLGAIRSGPETGATHYTLGYEYALSKRTNLFSYVTRLKNRRQGSYDFATNEIGIGAGASLTGVTLGVRHVF